MAGPAKPIRRTMIACLTAAAIACGGEESRAPDTMSLQTTSHWTSTPKRDFSLAVSPASQTIAVGSSTSYTVDTVITAGKLQQVALSISDLPVGVTATFNPSTISSGQSATLQGVR